MAAHDNVVDLAAARLRVPVRLPLRSDDSRLMALSVSSLRLFWKCPERWRAGAISSAGPSRARGRWWRARLGAAAVAWYAATSACRRFPSRPLLLSSQVRSRSAC